MSCYLQIFIKILLWQFLSHLHCKDCHWKCIICSCRQHVLILMDKNILMLILILPTRLKFSLMSTSVYWNLTTFGVEKKWQNTSRCNAGIGHCVATDAINTLHPCWKIILHIWWSRKTPGGGVWGEIRFLFKYSAFWVEGHAGKHWWWVVEIC